MSARAHRATPSHAAIQARGVRALAVRALAVLALAVLGIGCAQPTELVVVVDAEPRLTVRRVIVDVFGSGAGQRAEADLTAEGAPRLPLTLGIVPQREGITDITVQVAATVRLGEDGADETLLRVVRTSFVPGSSRMIHVVLSASCIAYACPDERTCDLAGCIPIDVAPETLPSWSGTPPLSPDEDTCGEREELCNGFDEDCDGMVDETIDLVSSPDDCGRCGRSCADGGCANGLCTEDRVSRLAAGGAHVCALRESGIVACWGANHERQTADLGEVLRAVPTTQVGVGFRDVAAGVDHTCVLTLDGRAACVGNGTTGALGTGTRDQSKLDILVATTGNVTEIETGAGLTMAIVNSHIVLWGTLNGTRTEMPTEVAHPGTFTQVAAGMRHTCGLLSTGRVACAAANDRGQLGQGDTMARPMEIVEVEGLDMVTDIAAGRDVTCALRMGGSVWCWGANDAGQLGVAGADRPTAAAVPGLGEAVSVDVARAGMHACAALRDGTVACWGDNSSGALGDGTMMPRAGVVSVMGVRGAQEVACGGLGLASGFSCARLMTGAVVCWGADDLGQTGDGDPGVETLVPNYTIGRP